MPTKCDECKKEAYVTYITKKYACICAACYDKIRTDKPKEKK